MLIEEAFKFCPLCGSGEFSKVSQANYLECSSCKFKYFLNPIASISSIIVNEKGQILLIKKSEGYRKGAWDTPGGFIDNEETLEEGAKREIREEIGVESRIIKFFHAGTNPKYEYAGISRPVVGVFVISEIISGTIEAHDDAEEYKWFDPQEILTLDIAYPDVKETLEKYIASSKP